MKYHLAYFHFGAVIMREGSQDGKYAPATRKGILALIEAGAFKPCIPYSWSIADRYTRTHKPAGGCIV